MDDFDNLYEEMIRRELGSEVLNPKKPSAAIYEGEIAFSLQVSAVKHDTPPPGLNTTDKYYRFRITKLDHDTLILILVSLRDLFSNIPKPFYNGIKKLKIQKELESLGISYMSKWISRTKNNTYMIYIRHLTYSECTKICKILFSY